MSIVPWDENRVIAIETAIADLTQLLDNTPPVGSITYLAHEEIDERRFLPCDGRPIGVQDEAYKRLYLMIGTTYGGDGQTFNLPDLRGEFIRGLDAGRNVDPGRQLGVPQEHRTAHPQNPFIIDPAGGHNHQIDGVGDHAHSYHDIAVWRDHGADNGYWHIINGEGTASTGGAGAHNHTLHPVGDHTHNLSGGDSETAPRNLALVPCIRY